MISIACVFVLLMDKCTARVRVRDGDGEDVKATTIKENKKGKENTCLLYMEIDMRKNAVVECAILRIKQIYTQLFKSDI